MKQWKIHGIVALTILIGFGGCEKKPRQKVDLSNRVQESELQQNANGSFRVAVSAMTSPKQTILYYQNLIEYLAERLGKTPHFVQRKTYQEVNEMLEKGQVDLAFICSGAYVDALEKGIKLRLVAVPVINDSVVYHSDIIVPENSPARSFDDLRGCRFAFTDPLSNTGYRYPLFLLMQRKTTPDSFFREYFFTYAHDNSIQAVKRGIADAASVDELIYMYLAKHNPESVAGTRILLRSQPFGIPPVVSHRGLPQELFRKVQEILLSMHQDGKGKAILNKLDIYRFVPADDHLYDSVREMYRISGERWK